MLERMKLADAVRDIDTFDKEQTIYAAKPWTMDSAAIVAKEPDDGGLPPQAKEQQMAYFLEVFIANDFLNDWVPTLPQSATLEQKCRRIIEYAINDA